MTVLEEGHAEYDQHFADAIGVSSSSRKNTVHTLNIEVMFLKVAILNYRLTEDDTHRYWANSQGPIPVLYRMLLRISLPPTTRTNVNGGTA